MSEVTGFGQFLVMQVPGVASKAMLLSSHVDRIRPVEEGNAAFFEASCGGQQFGLQPPILALQDDNLPMLDMLRDYSLIHHRFDKSNQGLYLSSNARLRQGEFGNS